ncbi:MAG: PepSY domain-containing protein [Bacillus sp. (in: firmicutes)]
MKRKIIAGIASLLLVGGAVGAAAAAGTANGSMKDPSHGSRQLLTSKQAEEIALRQVTGHVRPVEFKKHNGRMLFEVEIRTAGSQDDDEVTLDAVSGKVLKVERDEDNDANVRQSVRRQTQNRQTAISKEQAVAIALQETPGKVTEIDSDKNVYEIEIRN